MPTTTDIAKGPEQASRTPGAESASISRTSASTATGTAATIVNTATAIVTVRHSDQAMPPGTAMAIAAMAAITAVTVDTGNAIRVAAMAIRAMAASTAIRDTAVVIRDTVADMAPATHSLAFDNGSRDGYEKGREDIRKNRSFDPLRHSWYRSGDRHYEGQYGSRDEYKNIYRRGFQQGYERGYQEGRYR